MEELQKVVDRICQQFKKLIEANPQLMHGFKKQLPLYMAHENTEKAIYLVIDNGHQQRLNAFQDYYNTLNVEDRKR